LLQHCKVLKWLANRRARTGNTLPHNGSVHPRKIVKIRQLRAQAEQAASQRAPRRRTARGRRSSRFLPESVVDGLRRWYDEHLGYPYPSDAEKRRLADQLGTTVVKVTNWFANRRNRSGGGGGGAHGHGGDVGGDCRHESATSASAGLTAMPAADWRSFSVAGLHRSLAASTHHLNQPAHLP